MTAQTDYTPIDPAFKHQWCDALRGGKFQQCHGQLVSEYGHCCIGVGLAVLTGTVEKGEDTETAARLIGIDRLTEVALVDQNDSGKSFRVIANWIERNL
jgi:hypothetical protein